MITLPSPNFNDRPSDTPIDMLVLHYTGMQSAEAAIARLRDPVANVSSHYVVDEDGTIYQLVDENRRAYHAGLSYWRGRRGLNDVSIGIEIVNPGHELGYRAFPPLQMQAVRDLCRDIVTRRSIDPLRVVGHSDIAPNRKQDPGELFDWAGLAQDGIGFFPPSLVDIGYSTEMSDDPDMRIHAARDLARIGYDPDPAYFTDTITGFQRHWRQNAVTGRPDLGTLAALRVVAAASPA